MESETVRILDTRIDVVERQGIAGRLASFLDDTRPHLIVTANPEIVLQAHRDAEYRRVLDGSSLTVADGFGLVIAAALQGRGVRRITGSDVIEGLFSIAHERRLGVYVALKPDGLSSRADIIQMVARRWPQVRMSEQNDAAVVISNFGHPAQESWLWANRSRFSNARILVGVGGALDYLTGRVARAPHSVRIIGLEWLWRLFRQPRRVRRIIRAVIQFPLILLTHRSHRL